MNYKNIFELYSIFIFGIILFFIGFFTISYNDESPALEVPLNIEQIRFNSTYKRHISKLTLMVVDAMRHSFVSESNMPYSAQEGTVLKLRTNVPTVTMPRIKCLTMGTIPNFIDVILNFGSSAVTEDSLIDRLHEKGDKIVFYGDNTWTKLFPGKFFRQFENTDSFFVQDFYEGDKNITRQLAMEFENGDWDVLVLHYLGLDHIGHVEGSNSPKIKIKLQEMDNVVKTIVEKSNENGNYTLPAIAIVTADHGMRLTGGHGGSTPEEIFIPLLTFQSRSNSTIKSSIYNQIDVAPTLSILLGTKIPKTSIGCLIPELLDFLSEEDQLYSYYYNGKHLFRRFDKKFGNQSSLSSDFRIEYSKAKKLHIAYLQSGGNRRELFNAAKESYCKASRAISSTLERSFGQFHFDLILIGIGFTTMSTINLFQKDSGSTKMNFNTKSRNYLNPLIIIFSGYLLSTLVQFVLCYFNTGGDIYFCPITKYSFLGFGSVMQLLIHFFFKTLQNSKNLYIPVSINVAVVCIFHALSLTSSSFIEEEHQTWYYICNSILLLLSGYKIFAFSNPNSSLKIWVLRLHDNFDWIIVLLLNLFVRKLNQTGDKWLHLPDIGDWLIDDKNWHYLQCFLIFGLVILLISNKPHNSRSSNTISVFAVLLIFVFRFLAQEWKMNYNIIKLFWILLFLMVTKSNIEFIYRTVKRKHPSIQKLLSNNYTAITLVCALLHKPYNIILVPTLTMTLKIVYATIPSVSKSEIDCLALKSVLTLWIAKLFYYYQGNSNSLATIDVSPGFAGLSSYNFTIVAFLTVVNTYGAHICSFILLMVDLSQNKSTYQIIKQLDEALPAMLFVILFPVNVYLFYMIIFREHLFIWTVFSPKFLYEACYAILYYLLFIITLLYLKMLNTF